MAKLTKLTRNVVREVTATDLAGKAGSIVCELHSWGITLRAKGASRRLNITWSEMVRGGMPATNAVAMPPRFVTNPLGWLLELQ